MKSHSVEDKKCKLSSKLDECLPNINTRKMLRSLKCASEKENINFHNKHEPPHHDAKDANENNAHYMDISKKVHTVENGYV